MNDAIDAVPFAKLTPDCILSALEAADFKVDGRLMALNSYENRVYQFGIEDGAMRIAKFYRPNRWSNSAILEEHTFSRALLDAELPIVAPIANHHGETLHTFDDFLFAVFPRQGGHSPELDDPDMLNRLGRLIGRIHAIGTLKAYHHRPTLNIESFGQEPSDYLLNHRWIPDDITDTYRNVVTQALEEAQRCFDRAGDVAFIRIHGDCYAGNILCMDGHPSLVDFDDSRMGPAVQDLWMLLPGPHDNRLASLNELLSGYETFFEFDPRELYLVEALRTLRMIHYSAWLAKRWHDPAFPPTFPWFAQTSYWVERIQELKQQVMTMKEPVFI